MILGTDMSKHFEMREVFKKGMADIQSNSEAEVALTANQVQLLMKHVVHACDISNPTMNFDDFKEWGLRIT